MRIMGIVVGIGIGIGIVERIGYIITICGV